MKSVAESLAPLALVRAHKWRRATFTTYSFSASFAEAVLVEALMRQGVTEITILTDLLGYRMALRERGAVRIGREYIVHPIAVRDGCFHPKVMVLEADDATHVTIGSNNLTFGGWSANLECIEHIHTAGMAAAVGDVGRFFTTLADAPSCQHDARIVCRDLGKRLVSAAATGSDKGNVRVLSSLDGSIAGRLQDAAEGLGGAKSLTVASPYWESGAVERLAKMLGLSEVRAHVPRRRVAAPEGMDWPREARGIRPVVIDHLAVEHSDTLGLHAKMFEVVCVNGRLVLSGSANATQAALLHGGATSRNVEVCVLRTEPGAGHPWSTANAKAPPKPKTVLDPEDNEDNIGVLVAAYVNGGIEGRVLTPWKAGSAKVTLEAAMRSLTVGTVKLVDGKFAISTGQLDHEDLSLEGRIQLRLESEGEAAEGFVTAPDFSAIKGRAGKALPSMLAVLKNLQSPEDVLAMLEFFRANPDTLITRETFRSNPAPGSAGKPDPLVDADLVCRKASDDAGSHDGSGNGSSGKNEIAWQSFVARLLEAFGKGQSREEGEGGDDEEIDRVEKTRRKRAARARNTLELRFPSIFSKLIANMSTDVELVNLVRLTHFVCVATDHPNTASFLRELVGHAKTLELGSMAKDLLAWCIVQLVAQETPVNAAAARARMLSLGIDPSHVPDAAHALVGFSELIAPGSDLDAIFSAIRKTRTVYDDIQALEEGLIAGTIPGDLEVLGQHPQWPKLLGHCMRPPENRKLRFVDRPVSACSCGMVRPHIRDDLRDEGICDTRCHGFILVRNP